jgi:hypothetical protein
MLLLYRWDICLVKSFGYLSNIFSDRLLLFTGRALFTVILREVAESITNTVDTVNSTGCFATEEFSRGEF